MKIRTRSRSFKLTTLFLMGLVLIHAFPLKAQGSSSSDVTLSDKALRNAIIETCYGTRVLIDLNDPKKTEVSLEEAGLSEKTKAALIADSEKTDGSYEALSDLLISYCLGAETVTRIRQSNDSVPDIQVILVDAGIKDIDAFFIVVNEYTYFEQYIYTYFESYSFSQEQYAAIFFALEFSTSVELTNLLVEYGVEEEAAASFVSYAEETIDVIESEEPVDIDEDGILNVEDTDDDGDGIEDAEDTDDNGDGVEDVDQDDDTDNDGIDDEDDTDDDNDGIEDVDDTDIDGDGVDDDDADGDGVLDDEDTDDDGDGIEDAEDTDDDGDGVEEDTDDSMMDDGGVDDAGGDVE